MDLNYRKLFFQVNLHIERFYVVDVTGLFVCLFVCAFLSEGYSRNRAYFKPADLFPLINWPEVNFDLGFLMPKETTKNCA